MVQSSSGPLHFGAIRCRRVANCLISQGGQAGMVPALPLRSATTELVFRLGGRAQAVMGQAADAQQRLAGPPFPGERYVTH